MESTSAGTATLDAVDLYLGDSDNVSFGDAQDVVMQWNGSPHDHRLPVPPRRPGDQGHPHRAGGGMSAEQRLMEALRLILDHVAESDVPGYGLVPDDHLNEARLLLDCGACGWPYSDCKCMEQAS